MFTNWCMALHFTVLLFGVGKVIAFTSNLSSRYASSCADIVLKSIKFRKFDFAFAWGILVDLVFKERCRS